MQKKNLVFSFVISGLIVVSYQTMLGANHEPYGVEQSEILENFEGFDDYDLAIEEAMEMGIFKNQPEMRQPYWGEVPLRKMASYLFMRYIDVRSAMHAGCGSIKSWTSKAWQALFGTAK